jgi:hypothetical protein
MYLLLSVIAFLCIILEQEDRLLIDEFSSLSTDSAASTIGTRSRLSTYARDGNLLQKMKYQEV